MKRDLVLLALVLLVLSAVTIAVLGRSEAKGNRLECANNVRNLLRMLMTLDDMHKLGKDNAMALIVGASGDVLFCPGDRKRERRTSYAGRDLRDPDCAFDPKHAVAVLADDSADHHENVGFVVGYTDGQVRFREWGPVAVGRDSPVAELRCLRAD